MSLAQLTTTIRSPFNEGVPGVYNELVSWLSSHPNISIQDVDWYRPASTFAGDALRLRMAYLQASAPSIGSTWAARLFRTQNGITAQDSFNSAFGTGLTLVPMFVLDVTNHERGINDPDSIIAIGVDTGESPLGLVGHPRAAFVAQADADVSAGGSGPMTIYDASGRNLGTGVSVRNVGGVDWLTNQRNYIVFDDVSGELIGLPSCCAPGGVLPAISSTTTSAYPCPAYLPGAQFPVSA